MVIPIIPQVPPEKEELVASKHIDHSFYNTPRDTFSGKYVIKILRFDFGTP